MDIDVSSMWHVQNCRSARHCTNCFDGGGPIRGIITFHQTTRSSTERSFINLPSAGSSQIIIYRLVFSYQFGRQPDAQGTCCWKRLFVQGHLVYLLFPHYCGSRISFVSCCNFYKLSFSFNSPDVCYRISQVEFRSLPVIGLTWNLAYISKSGDNAVNWFWQLTTWWFSQDRLRSKELLDG